jgi:hypothetical protein
MTCCQTTYKPFANVSQTILPWSGNRPTVTVSYLVDGVWVAMGVQTVINIFNGGDPNAPADVPVVVVDHGGPATGVVKMVQ